VGRRAHDHLGRDVAGLAGLVLDVERLAELIGEPAGNQPAEDVVRSSRRKADQETDGTRRIGLRHGVTRQCGQRRELSGLKQDVASPLVHPAAPSLASACLALPARCKPRGRYFTLMPAALITLAIFSVSSVRNLPNSSGVITRGTPPRSSSRD